MWLPPNLDKSIPPNSVCPAVTHLQPSNMVIEKCSSVLDIILDIVHLTGQYGITLSLSTAVLALTISIIELSILCYTPPMLTYIGTFSLSFITGYKYTYTLENTLFCVKV